MRKGSGRSRADPQSLVERRHGGKESPLVKQLDESKKVSVGDTYGVYQEKVVNLLCEAFLPIYKEISEPLFNNAMIASVKRSYHFYDQDLGVFEVWIPTHLNGEQLQQYFRLVVKVEPECDHRRLVKLSRELRRSFTSPMGIMDSEMIIIVSPKPKINEKGIFPHGYCHNIYRGFMTFFIPAKFALQAIHRILLRVAAFFMKRLEKLGEKLNLPEWMMNWLINSMIKGKKIEVLYTLTQRLSLNVSTLLNNLLGLTLWFTKTFKKIGNEIGRITREIWKVSTFKQTIRKCKDIGDQLKGLLDENEIKETLGKLKTILIRKIREENDRAITEEKSTYIEIEVNSPNFSIDRSIDRFTDRPEDLERREKAYLDYLTSQGG